MTSLHHNSSEFVIDWQSYHINIGGLYNIYNALAAVSVAQFFGVDPTTIKTGFDKSRAVFGRQETFKIGDKECTLVLIKNPVGATQALEMIKLAPYPFSLSVLLNANYADGIDTSWIWDADFEQVLNMDIPHMIAGGVRHSEIARRLRVTGYNAEQISEVADLSRVFEKIKNQACLYPSYLHRHARVSRIAGFSSSRQKGDELMVYTSLTSPENRDYTYDLKIAHLYGNLMNTYGDNGNILMLKYVAEKLGARVQVDIVSLEDEFDKDYYDLAFFGGGQDYEQTIVARDLPAKKDSLEEFINHDGVVLAICGGFQLLGQYYIEASGRRIEGLGIMGHYTLNQKNNRYIGDIKIHNDEFDETYYGFENHQGRTFLSEDEKPLGRIIYGNGNNKKDQSEGVHYKNVFGSYFHGPILSRNANLAYRLVTTALKNKYGQDIPLANYEDILAQEVPEEYGDVKSKAEFE